MARSAGELWERRLPMVRSNRLDPLDPLKACFGCLLGELDYYPGVRVLDTC